MSERRFSQATPFASKQEFLKHGMVDAQIQGLLDCSICREPLTIGTATSPVKRSPLQELDVNANSLLRVTAHHDTGSRRNDPRLLHLSANKPSPLPQDTDPLPESALRIGHCGHVFGSICLAAWFATSSSNRCPECNQTLFPDKRPRMRLFLREPTREMRLDFANIVEGTLDDPITADHIREHVMSEWTRVLMRELAIEIHRAQGYEVVWEYVMAPVPEQSGEDEDDNEDEDSSSDEEVDDPFAEEYEHEDEEMDTDSKDGSEYEDDDDEEMDSDDGLE
jgi:hypothetical protein